MEKLPTPCVSRSTQVDRSPPSRQDGNTYAVHRAFLWFASIRVRLWKTAAVRQVASIATMRKSSGRKPTPPCVPLVRLHSSNICIATCTPLRVSWFANHPNRSRQIGRRRQCRRLVVTTSVVSAVSVVVGTARLCASMVSMAVLWVEGCRRGGATSASASGRQYRPASYSQAESKCVITN